MPITEVNTPATEPVALPDAKAHLRVTANNEDAYITGLVAVARRSVESLLGRALIERDFDQTLDRFPRVIRLDLAPVSAVASVKYLDENGVEQTLDPTRYEVDLASTPARIKPAYGDTWPTTRRAFAAVTVRFTAGYGASAADVPEDILHGIKLMISHLYQQREPVVTGTITSRVPETIDALLLPHKIWLL